MSDTFPDTRGTCIPRLLGVKNYVNNYFAMYTRLTRSRMRVDLASFAYLRLGIARRVKPRGAYVRKSERGELEGERESMGAL